MTTGSLLAEVERAAREAFPDRAEPLIETLERRLWLTGSTLLDDDADAEILPSSTVCASCGRADYAWIRAVLGVGRTFQRYAEDDAWRVRVDGGSVRLPVVVCGACRAIGGDDGASDDAVLADLVRAVRASALAPEPLVHELERRFAGGPLPARSSAPCACCGEVAPHDGHRGRFCDACWARARAIS